LGGSRRFGATDGGQTEQVGSAGQVTENERKRELHWNRQFNAVPSVRCEVNLAYEVHVDLRSIWLKHSHRPGVLRWNADAETRACNTRYRHITGKT
jgi:hypothetical protein